MFNPTITLKHILLPIVEIHNSVGRNSFIRKYCVNLYQSCLTSNLLLLRGKTLKKNKKPEWVTSKEKNYREGNYNKVWLYGIHAVRDALYNKKRIKHQLIITPNAQQKLKDAILNSALTPEVIDPRKFLPPLERNSVHQGVALEVSPLNWGSLSEICAPRSENKLVLLLDRVTDPQNVGAILRSAEVFGATAVASPARYSPPETGALAKTASGALERQPYVRLPNLARAIMNLKQMGYFCIGLDGNSNFDIVQGLKQIPKGPIALILGAEGPGLRELTIKNCDKILKIPSHAKFGSLNVSNAAAVSLFTARAQINTWDLNL